MQLQKKNTYIRKEDQDAGGQIAGRETADERDAGENAGASPALESTAREEQSQAGQGGQEARSAAAPADPAGLGALLRAAREARGLSLADVANALKLGEDALSAIEEGRYEIFPHKAYARGFLRSYAQYLKVPRETCQPVLDILSPRQEFDTPVYAPQRAARPRRHRPWIGVVASLAIACLIGFAIWYFNLIDLVVREASDEPQTVAPMPSSASPTLDRQMREREETVRRAQAERAQKQANASASGAVVNPNLPQGMAGSLSGNMQDPAQATPGMPRGAGSSVSEGSPTLSLVDPGEREPLPAVVTPGSPWSTLQGNATIAGEAGLAEPEPAPSGVSGINSVNPNLPQGVNPASQAAGPNTVVVVAETTCWTSVTVDNARSVQRTLQTGESLTLNFAQSLRLRLGNAGGVRVYYNGRELDRGRQGQVRNWNFPLTADEMPN